MQEKLNLVKYLHLIKVSLMVFSEHLHEVGIHFHLFRTLIFLWSWHASRAVFQDLWTGVLSTSFLQVEYGRNEKLGNNTTAGTFI